MPSNSPEYARAWREKNKAQIRGTFKAWADRNREALRESVRRRRAAHPATPSGTNGAEAWNRWHAANPEKARLVKIAQRRVWRAVRSGRLTRPEECSKCGKQGRIDAAHYDYARPLEVRWLCRSCHSSWDRLEPKTKQAAS